MVKILFLPIIVAISIFLRFYLLDKVPPGLNFDEASQGYDAYSLLLTGKDQWGKSFPVYLRSFGDFKSPLYTYLTIIPVYLFGLSIFSVRFISAFLGVLIVIFTYLIIKQCNNRNNENLIILSTLLVSISPWSVFFSRGAMEANIALGILLVSLLFFILSLKKAKLIILASFLLGISNYAYHAQKIISFSLILCFLAIFRNRFINKKILLIAVLVFLLVQIPQFTLISTKANARRLDQVNYWSQLHGNILENTVFVIRKFASQYTTYLSPRNLFFDPDPQELHSIPDLSVFYSFLIIPFFFGVVNFLKKAKEPVIQLLIIIAFSSLIPAALTGEPFYTIRVLPYLWVITVLISFGVYTIYQKFNPFVRNIFIIFFTFLSLMLLYSKYFILLPYERNLTYGYPYIELSKRTEELKGSYFLIDTGRDTPYTLFAVYRKYNPSEFQKNNRIENLNNYYNDINFTRSQIVGNIKFRSLNWETDTKNEQILVGDSITISSKQISEHNLTLKEKFKDLAGNDILYTYVTNPKKEDQPIK